MHGTVMLWVNKLDTTAAAQGMHRSCSGVAWWAASAALALRSSFSVRFFIFASSFSPTCSCVADCFTVVHHEIMSGCDDPKKASGLKVDSRSAGAQGIACSQVPYDL